MTKNNNIPFDTSVKKEINTKGRNKKHIVIYHSFNTNIGCGCQDDLYLAIYKIVMKASKYY